MALFKTPPSILFPLPLNVLFCMSDGMDATQMVKHKPLGLPNELWHHVFEFLLGDRDQASITSLRLVCRGFGIIGLEYILPRMSIFLTEASYDRLKQVSEHPILSKHVRSLFLCRDPIQKYDVYKEFEIDERDLSCYLLNREKKKLIYQRYQQYVAEQEFLLEPGHIEKLVAEAVSNLSGLQECEVGSRVRGGHDVDNYKAFHAYIVEGSDFKRSVASLLTTSKDLKNVRTRLTKGVLLGLQPHNKLKRLDVDYPNWSVMGDLSKLTKNLKNLKQLQIGECGCAEDRQNHVLQPRGKPRFHKFVTSLPNLQNLRVGLCITGLDDTMIGSSFTWSSLRVLILDNASLEQDLFINLLERHGKTLKDLSYSGDILIDGDDTLSSTEMVSFAKKIKDVVQLEICHFWIESLSNCWGRFSYYEPKTFRGQTREIPADIILEYLISERIPKSDCRISRALGCDYHDSNVWKQITFERVPKVLGILEFVP
jgi:hypothetical protein